MCIFYYSLKPLSWACRDFKDVKQTFLLQRSKVKYSAPVWVKPYDLWPLLNAAWRVSVNPEVSSRWPLFICLVDISVQTRSFRGWFIFNVSKWFHADSVFRCVCRLIRCFMYFLFFRRGFLSDSVTASERLLHLLPHLEFPSVNLVRSECYCWFLSCSVGGCVGAWGGFAVVVGNRCEV